MKVLQSLILSAVTVLFFTAVTTAAPAADEVKSYPGFGVPPTPHYSGYLDASDGCNTKRRMVLNVSFITFSPWQMQTKQTSIQVKR